MDAASRGPWILAQHPAPCAQHADALSGWRCETCDADKCERCVYLDPAPASNLTLCSMCGGVARVRLLPRRSFALLKQLQRALSAPLTAGGIMTVLLLAACMAIFEMPSRGGIVVRLANPASWLTRGLEMALFWAVFVEALRRGKDGHRDLVKPELVDSLGEAGLAFVRGTAALFPLLWLATFGRADTLETLVGDRVVAPLLLTTPIWTPLDAAYWGGFVQRTRQTGGWLWFGLAVYLIWLGQALCSFAEERGLAGALHPVVIARRFQGLGIDSVRLLVGLLLLGGTSVAAVFALTPKLLTVPFGAFVGAVVAIYPLLALGYLCGRVVYVRGFALDLGTAELFADSAVAVAPCGQPFRREKR